MSQTHVRNLSGYCESLMNPIFRVFRFGNKKDFNIEFGLVPSLSKSDMLLYGARKSTLLVAPKLGDFTSILDLSTCILASNAP